MIQGQGVALEGGITVGLGRMPGVPGLGGQAQIGESKVSHYFGSDGHGFFPGVAGRPGVGQGQKQQEKASQAEEDKSIRRSHRPVHLTHRPIPNP